MTRSRPGAGIRETRQPAPLVDECGPGYVGLVSSRASQSASISSLPHFVVAARLCRCTRPSERRTFKP